jgi:hypothetical protein
MAFQRGPNMVTNGLVLALDAGNTKSYVSGSTIWYDKSGNGNNGTLTNGPTFNSANGGSIVFDGVDDYYSSPDASSLDFSTAMSICMWVNRSGNGSQIEEILLHKESGGAPAGGYQLWIERATLKSVFRIRNSSNTSDTLTSTGSITTGQWAFLTSTYDGSNIVLYRNGINDGSKTTTINPIGNVTNVLSIGGVATNTSYNWNGNISSVQLYNRALSSQEVLQNYNALKSRYNPE